MGNAMRAGSRAVGSQGTQKAAAAAPEVAPGGAPRPRPRRQRPSSGPSTAAEDPMAGPAQSLMSSIMVQELTAASDSQAKVAHSVTHRAKLVSPISRPASSFNLALVASVFEKKLKDPNAVTAAGLAKNAGIDQVVAENILRYCAMVPPPSKP
eukprot:m.90309 g.90309  ORF g.90309 m.90309 type:complete len:153 (-) comp15005_c0_seq2:71-529(-)